jgi:hypothetical protein
MTWKFADPLNVAVFTIWPILRGEEFIGEVRHDAEDGDWQFLSRTRPFLMEEAALVTLRSMVERDPTLVELADLPLGWRAWRLAKGPPMATQEDVTESWLRSRAPDCSTGDPSNTFSREVPIW